jgi:hypothetical protein
MSEDRIEKLEAKLKQVKRDAVSLRQRLRREEWMNRRLIGILDNLSDKPITYQQLRDAKP